ncbi:hypothetical protein, partial [Streptomyces sp. NPDC058268]|uniref:hypothetical protein n=1 Tax=Streptomyces sp. NPDC058268 TaxID=3346413 RepID=UPI0036E0A3FD
DMDTAARYFGLYDTDAEVAADAGADDTAEIEGDAHPGARPPRSQVPYAAGHAGSAPQGQ